MTEVRSGTFKECQFPFVLLNQTFNECTNILSVNQETGKITTVDEPWCSTKVDPKTYKHIEGGSYYGDCPRNCHAQEAKRGYYSFKNFIGFFFKFDFLQQAATQRILTLVVGNLILSKINVEPG